MSDVTIGVSGSQSATPAPRIGNRVFIGSEAGIIGELGITI